MADKKLYRRGSGEEVLDERNGGHRWEDKIAEHMKAILISLGLLVPLAATAIAIGATKATTAAEIRALDRDKVDRDEWLVKSASQDRERWGILLSIDSLKVEIRDLTPAVLESNRRIREIYCENKPASCR